MTQTQTAPVVSVAAEATIFVRLFTVLRVFTGLVFFTNGFAKLIETRTYDLGFFSFNLVDKSGAKSILTGAAHRTQIRLLGAFYESVVLPHWGIFSVFLTVTELAIGIGLILGIASRLAAVGGLMLIFPIWVMLWHSGKYLWEYPAEDLFPLVLLAIAPAGRHRGVDARLAPRFGNRWPF
jgi:uncharacterized membrane protein YphA (DoxX/SURF4 family)